jgi:hypothetical protein
MDVHQCPRCELRFVHTSELRHHFEFDHAADPRVFDRYRYRSRSGVEDSGRTILLVGNQTLERDAVLEEVISRAGADVRVFVVVPATNHGEETGVALARVRLGSVLDRLREAGLDADGEVGDADPYAAVCHALAGHEVAEILLSTLPPSSSRWLSVDLPDRLRRHTARPVTVLTPAAVAGGAD